MNGTSYTDDPTILKEDRLFRRIPPLWFVTDDNLGRIRPTSQAFRNHRDGSPMSVALEKVLLQLNKGPETVLEGQEEGFSLVSLTAGLARDCNQGIALDSKDLEPAHSVVFGKKTDGVRDRFAKESIWVIPPTTTTTQL